MRKAMLLLAVFGFVGVLWAQSPFDGAWKIKWTAPKEAKPTITVLQNGVFECTGCKPEAIKAKADGTDQPHTGSKQADTIAVKIVNDRTVETTFKKSGKVVQTIKDTVSADGKMSTAVQTDYTEARNQQVLKAMYTRVAAGPLGSHATSGSWQLQNVEFGPMTLKSSPDGLMSSSLAGESFEAKFDGKDYPVKGATPSTTVSLTKVNERTIDQTTKQDGKIMSVAHMTVSDDGKTMTIKSELKEAGTTSTVIAIKQ